MRSRNLSRDDPRSKVVISLRRDELRAGAVANAFENSVSSAFGGALGSSRGARWLLFCRVLACAICFAFTLSLHAERPVIYQLMVRHFGNRNATNKPHGTLAENGCGKFADINDAALKSLRDLGITHVWLTGVLQQATRTDYSAIGQPADDARGAPGAIVRSEPDRCRRGGAGQVDPGACRRPAE